MKTAPTRTVKVLRVRLPRSKYGNTKVVIDGFTFDSKAEGRRYQDLCYLQQAGKITKLHPHPVYELLPAFTDMAGRKHRRTTYIGDFFYYDDDFNAVVEDVKGRETEVFKIKAKMFQHRYPSIKFVIVKGEN